LSLFAESIISFIIQWFLAYMLLYSVQCKLAQNAIVALIHCMGSNFSGW